MATPLEPRTQRGTAENGHPPDMTSSTLGFDSTHNTVAEMTKTEDVDQGTIAGVSISMPRDGDPDSSTIGMPATSQLEHSHGLVAPAGDNPPPKYYPWPQPHPASPPTLKLLLWRHLLDWVSFLLLAGIAAGVTFLGPVQNFIGVQELAAHDWPLLDESVPMWAVVFVGVVAPILAFVLYFAFRRDWRDLHQSLLGLCYALALTALITDALKVGVGRPRPDFFWRCFPNGKPVFSSSGNVLCTGTPSVVEEGRLSFPSGHTSWAFSGLGFLSLYLCAKLHTFSPLSGLLWTLLPPLIPMFGATAIAISRVVDYWHFPTDVIAGALIGLAMSSLCYFIFYPALTHKYCHKTRISVAKVACEEAAAL